MTVRSSEIRLKKVKITIGERFWKSIQKDYKKDLPRSKLIEEKLILRDNSEKNIFSSNEP